ncbi:MAG: hypothetical protein IRZ07_16240, partial [Microbispora sp.]|nr:hypothetical protein [Microbispora sp.]
MSQTTRTESGASPRASLGNPVMITAVLLVVASLAVRIPILTSSYFVEDDFLFVGDAYEHSLTFDFLFRIHKGHLMPGALGLTWVLSRLSPYNWVLVSAVTLAVQAAVAVMLLRLLVRLFGPRPGILPPLTLALFSPLTVPAFGWWSAAINAVPLQLAMVMALAAQVRYVREGGARHARGAFCWVLVGMAFSTKGVFVPFLLFALTTSHLRPWAGPWIALMLRELRSHWRLWGSYALLIGGYTALYLARRDTAPGEGAAVPAPGDAADLLGRLLGRIFPAGVAGGPLSWGPVLPNGGLADPGPLLVAAGWAVLAALVIATVLWRRRAVRAWVILAGYLVAADGVPTAIARGTGLAQVVGSETRYVADAAIVLALCVGLALLPLRDEAEPYRRPVPAGSGVPAAAGLLAGAYLAMSIISIQNYRDTLSGDRVRAYLDTVRSSLAKAPDTAVIYSSPLPEDIVLPWNGNRRLSHHLLAPLARPALRARMRVPEPSEHPLVFDGKGRLVPAEVKASIGVLPPGGRSCFPLLGDAIFFPDVVSFGGPGPVAGLAYTAKRAGTGSYEMSGQREQLRFHATGSGGALVRFPVTAVGKGLLIRLDDPSAVCLKGFAYGDPVPGAAAPTAAATPSPSASPSPSPAPASPS